MKNYMKRISVVFASIACSTTLLPGQMLSGSINRTNQPVQAWNHHHLPSVIAPASVRLPQEAATRDAIGSSQASAAQLGSDFFHHPEQTQNWQGCSSQACSNDVCGDCKQDCNRCRYVKFFGGWNFLDDVDTTFGTANIPGTLDFNDGWVLGTAVGSYVTPDLRRELEFTFRDNTGNSLMDGGVMIGDLSGRVQTYSIMGNIIRDFRSRSGGIQPYIGGGLGIAIVDADLSWMGEVFNIDDAAFAYQAFAGMQRQLSHRMSAFVEYRFFGTTDLEIENGMGTTREPYNTHNILLGIQLRR